MAQEGLESDSDSVHADAALLGGLWGRVLVVHSERLEPADRDACSL
jgi:hypothetical protein